jgi:hypothetical protein
MFQLIRSIALSRFRQDLHAKICEAERVEIDEVCGQLGNDLPPVPRAGRDGTSVNSV